MRFSPLTSRPTVGCWPWGEKMESQATSSSWSVSAARSARSLKGHKERVECVRFSPNGRLLVSGGGYTREIPGQVYVWRLAELQGLKPAGTLSAKELELLWNVLAGDDAAKAYQAIGTLATAKGQTVALLNKRLQLPGPIDEKNLLSFVKDLDDDRFEVREKASKTLEAHGPQIEPLLIKVLAGKPSAEVRERISQVLERLNQSPQVLQNLRAVELLETIGSVDARTVLERLAGGPEETRLTQEAKWAVERLGKKR